jgi:hypothetical protein
MKHAGAARGPDRRQFCRRGVAAAAAALGLTGSGTPAAEKRLKVAAVFTEFTYRSHAHVLLENFLEPYYFDGRPTDPGCEVVAFYADQFPARRDLARAVAKAYRIPVYPTIDGALCAGGKELAVDAVLSIGEHGNYPVNPKGQREYPRRRFFDEIVAVFRRSGRVVPVFNDKHLSYRWDWARGMYDTAREMKIPLMAGSSVPLAQRVPPVEVPPGSKILEAVSVHGGGLDSYDFHALEVLQSMVEGRAGGETGVDRVQYLAGEALWRAADAGQWSPALLQAAWDAEPDRNGRRPTLEQLFRSPPWGLLLHYRDGLRGLALKVGSDGTRWNFACRLAGAARPLATSFYVGPWNNRSLFKTLAHAIQMHFRTGAPPYPVERTLLTTGLVAAGVESHFLGDKPYATPHLGIAYGARDCSAVRETGASWRVVTEAAEEPKGIDRLGKVAFPFPRESVP